ncbi:MAG: 6,7-dimethyl-8-ribityllumazine synthase [Euryarchaeota archaeon]|nr:6,7-dimethyl-8-ribityllumazine synthase [Euryarchaeota archaeon]MDE1837615.1 6,7-dimethyl-8-ribityllumazine synthase [Euryarchaeota archaeon]MDE1880807.1 6,7-dimethyl-8-ribityllumazine synthase [Euryarchaeota archaeon]MDE2045954.1 6,7-dimethyl-8-ribityllumazine synthase [Thermoplasmata archaeon]
MPPSRTHRPAPAQALDGRGVRLAIVASEYHPEILERMVEDARRQARQLGSHVVATVRVPGTYDIPLAVQRLLARKDVDAAVALGAVLQGETDHDQVIMYATTKTLQELSLARSKPVGLGITGPGETRKQALARVDRAGGAVRAVVAMVQRLRPLRPRR